MSDVRETFEVPSIPGGWPAPWPSAAELASALPVGSWTLVGGLMTQLHTITHGLDVVRPTNDVDIVLHIETARGVPNMVATKLEQLGYRFQPSIDLRRRTAHRFVRGDAILDVVASHPPRPTSQQVDVLIADHPAPRVVEKLRGYEMLRIDGGTQALRRTVNAQMEIVRGSVVTISVPRPFGALMLKAAAFRADSRDRDRHLFDAAALLACIDDPFVERDGFAGSDRKRVAVLQQSLGHDHPAWRAVPAAHRSEAQQALEILASTLGASDRVAARDWLGGSRSADESP